MKILIVSYFFPPFNVVGAVRVGKYAKYLERMGHDVRVLSCADQPLPEGLPVEINPEHIVRTKWMDVNWPILVFLGTKHVQTKGFEISGASDGWMQRAKRAYQHLVHFPDAQIGWYPFARKAGLALCKQWKPDLIYASALPVTSLFIASYLSRKCHIPWFAEFRDLWADNHNRAVPSWRRILERHLESRLVESASGMVTVSEPLADTLKHKYPNKSVMTLPNGFDAEDFDETTQNEDAVFSPMSLNLLYTGMLYKEKYDLDPLLKALSSASSDVRLDAHFFGRYIGFALHEARRLGVDSLVHCHDPVDYARSISLQKNADILLMFLWNDPEQKGVYTGKLFEYLAARRPILAVGTKDSAPARLIIERRAGLVSDDPNEIADWLRQQSVIKSEQGRIPMLDESVSHGFSREEQVDALDGFIRSCLSYSGEKQ